MKQLLRTNQDIPWMVKPSIGRLYITDELPPREVWGTAFGFAFEGDRMLVTHLKRRGWDIPGGHIEVGETPEQATVREVWEETFAEVEIVDLIGIQELEILGPRPENHRYAYPVNTQIFFFCRVTRLAPFQENDESLERGFFSPDQMRELPMLINHDLLYEEALRRATGQ
jgi:8-oxo-dGTP diphosphatase